MTRYERILWSRRAFEQVKKVICPSAQCSAKARRFAVPTYIWFAGASLKAGQRLLKASCARF